MPSIVGNRRRLPYSTITKPAAIGITAVTFLLTQLVPSNAVATNLGEQAAGDPAAVAAFKAHYGLDKPLPQRYLIYLGHLLRETNGDPAITRFLESRGRAGAGRTCSGSSGPSRAAPRRTRT